MIELLIALTIGALLVGALASLMIVSARSFGIIRDSIDASAREQAMTGRFQTDVMSAEVVRGSATCTISGSHLRGFSWNTDSGEDPDPATQVHADWYLHDDAVRRVACGGGVTSAEAILLPQTASATINCAGRTCTLDWERFADVGPAGAFAAHRRVP